MTIVPIAIGAFGTVTKGYERAWRIWKYAAE